MIIGEFLLSFQELVLGANLIFALVCAKDSRGRPRYYLNGPSAPTIDVFVTCCGEPLDVILDTVVGVIAQDYPSQQLRVFVLDAVIVLGNNSKETGGPKVHHLSRSVETGVRSYFKAGNLQMGIQETERIGGSEFLASLDADMIPNKDWLRKIVPHLILSGDIGLACPPQCYYNIPTHDPLGQKAEFDLWFSVYEPLNDFLDAAMYTVAFIREDLQFGLAPDSLRSHVKQRMRWADSGIEVHEQFGFYFPGAKMTSEMTWVQRGVGILQVLREYAPLTNVLALALKPLAFYPSRSLETTQISSSKYRSLLWGIFMTSFCDRIVNNSLLYVHVGLGRVVNFQSTDIWCSPYTYFRCFMSILPASANSMTFESSGTIVSPVNERSKLHRKPLLARLLTLDMLMYFVYITYASTSLVLQVISYHTNANAERSGLKTFVLFPGPTLKLLDCILKASTPLWYMAFPPTVPEREELIEMDEQRVRRPKKQQVNNIGGVRNWLSLMDICSGCVIFWSWFAFLNG